MNDYRYFRPQTLEEALAVMKRFGSGASPLLGGTDLLVRIRKGLAEPEAVVDLKRVADIGVSIEAEEQTITVGARVVLSDLVEHEAIRKVYPALVEAASSVGSVQIRNRATLAGNICNASPAADTVPPLIVYGAAVVLAGFAGRSPGKGASGEHPASQRRVERREVPLRDYFLGPGKTVCGPAELVVAVRIPLPTAPFGAAFSRLTRRRGVDLATINMACAIDSEDITTFVFGAAGPTPILVREESGELARTDLPESHRDELLQSLIEKTSPISDVRSGRDYRWAMLLAIGRRVLREAQASRRGQAG